MDTPRPYSQRKLRDGTILREFRSDARSEELVWHQDRERRSVRVIESGGWKLQVEEGLPFPLVEGNTYEIPSRSWHRVLRGQGKLKIEIQEGNTMRITESQLRKIIREEIESEERNNIVSEIINNTDPEYVEKTLSTRNPTGALQAGSVFDETQTAESLKSANWMPLNNPAIKSPAIAFTANIPGKLGIVPIERISDDTRVKFQLSHGGTGGKSGKAIEVVSNFDANLARVDTTTLIAGPDKTDPNKYVMWTFHPGDPSPLSAEITEDIVKEMYPNMMGTVADAKRLGFKFVKNVASLSEGILKRKITESQLRRIVREEARRLLESVVDLENDRTTSSWLRQFTANSEDTELHADLVKAWDEMCKMAPNLTLSPSSNKTAIVDAVSGRVPALPRNAISFHIQGVKRLIDAGACPSGAAFAEAFEEYKASRPARAPTATGPDFYPMKGGGKVSAKPGEPRGSQELFDTADEAYSSLFYPDIGPDSWSVFKDPNTGKYWAIGKYDTYGT